MISRRAFASGLAAALGAGALPAYAQQMPAGAKPYRVGVLNEAFGPNPPVILGLKAGLVEQGLQEGRDVVFENVLTKGEIAALPAGAAALVKAKVDLIFAPLESRHVTAGAGDGSDDAGRHGIADVGEDDGDILRRVHCGARRALASPRLWHPKRLEILKTCAPALRRVWAVYARDDLSSAASARMARETESALGLEILDRPVDSAADAVTILKSVLKAASRRDGLLAPTTISLDITARVLDLAPFVPSVFDSPHWIQGGGLVAYGVDHEIQGRQAARLVARILRGTRPEDLPVEDSTKFELTINVRTARQLRLTIPPSLLARADRVIE